MTIAGWVIFALVAAAIMGLCITLGIETDNPAPAIIVGIVLVVALMGCMLFYFNFTASGKRAFHSQESELQNGLDRSVRVYDVQGELIYEYEGHFDIDYNEERIIFDDENGNRHIIYYSVATVIIEEE